MGKFCGVSLHEFYPGLEIGSQTNITLNPKSCNRGLSFFLGFALIGKDIRSLRTHDQNLRFVETQNQP